MITAQLAPTPAATIPTPTAPTPERLFTLEQIQAAGGFSRSTLYRLRHGGGLRVVTVGGLVRVRESDWQRFLDRYATAAPEGGAE